MVPGPGLAGSARREFAVRVVNELPEPTAVHWHGVRLANAMDGAPPLTQAPIAPGESFDYRFVAPDAGTFWYHPPRPSACAVSTALSSSRRPSRSTSITTLTLIFAAAAANGDRRSRSMARRISIFARAPMNVCGFACSMSRPTPNSRACAIERPAHLRDGDRRRNRRSRLRRARDDCCSVRVIGWMSSSIARWRREPRRRSRLKARAAARLVATIACEDGAPGRPARRDDPKPLPPNPLPERMDFHGALRFDAAIGRTACSAKRPLVQREARPDRHARALKSDVRKRLYPSAWTQFSSPRCARRRLEAVLARHACRWRRGARPGSPSLPTIRASG